LSPRLTPQRLALVFGLVKLCVHLATLTPYGYFRDELYYIRCSEALAWGYVDQPPLCIFVLRVWREVFGDSLAAIRLSPALLGAATVLMTGRLAIRLGGKHLAVALACTGVLTAGQYLGTAHYYSMNVLDQLAWTLTAYVLVDAVERQALKNWLLLGAVLGLGLLNKISVLWLGGGIAAGLVLTPARSTLRTRGPWLAGLLAAVMFAPFVVWQAAHGWPMAEFMHNATSHKYAAHSLGSFVKEQILQNNLFALPLWAVGLLALLIPRLRGRAPMPAGAAVLGWAYVAAFSIIASQKTAKAEYLSPAYPMLMAGGGVFVEGALDRARMWAKPALLLFFAAMLGGGALVAPFALACLSVDRFIAYQAALGIKPQSSERRELGDLTQFYADMHGWKELTDEVASIFASLPPEDRARATIWTRSGGYGPAAAIDFFGRGRGLPRVICAHNNYWLWGPGDGDGRVTIVVGGRADGIGPFFESFERVATFECDHCRPDENHKPIYIGRNLKTSYAALWPDERHYE
jgi:hypothetical protein